VRRLSLSTLVVDLAFVVRRNLERLRILRKGHEVQFEMVV